MSVKGQSKRRNNIVQSSIKFLTSAIKFFLPIYDLNLFLDAIKNLNWEINVWKKGNKKKRRKWRKEEKEKEKRKKEEKEKEKSQSVPTRTVAKTSSKGGVSEQKYI